MNVNGSYTGLQNVNDLQSTSLERIGSGLAINKASDDASGLAIADQLRMQKSVLTQSVENANSGIAMSQIAQGGIERQKEILTEIKTLTTQALNGTTSAEGRDAIANQINKYIEQYDQIADSTKYNGESLLKTAGDATDDLSIVGDESIIQMTKADTGSVSTNLKSFMGDFATNPNSMQNMLNAVDQGLTDLNAYASDYGSASNALESMARNYLTQETNTANARSTIMDIDYSKEVTDFNKTNLMSQIGYLMQTQANAHQQRNISLLS